MEIQVNVNLGTLGCPLIHTHNFRLDMPLSNKGQAVKIAQMCALHNRPSKLVVHKLDGTEEETKRFDE